MIPRNSYAYLTIGLATLWPFILLLWSWQLTLVIPLAALSIALFILVWKRVSVKGLTLLLGFEVISVRLASGCANISILYLPAFLMIVYLICVFYALNSLWRGREYAQSHWIKFVYKFVDKTAVAPPPEVKDDNS